MTRSSIKGISSVFDPGQIWVLIRVRQQDWKKVLASLGFNYSKHVVEEKAGDIREDDTHGERSVNLEAAGHVIETTN
jgi:hypothetical protein